MSDVIVRVGDTEDVNISVEGTGDENIGIGEQSVIKGRDGFSPIISVEEIEGGHRVNITDASGQTSFDVMDGEKGDTGTTFWFGTRAEYNALTVIDPAVCYCIEEGT